MILLKEMRVRAAIQTDILGAVELAAQEFEVTHDQAVRLLVVLSDFIQEDAQINFSTDIRM